jgi:P-type Cu+ transporter
MGRLLLGNLTPFFDFDMAATLLSRPDTESPSITTCFHCKEPCPPASNNNQLQIGDKQFCCAGCKMVYEILDTHNLCEYYRLDERPGVSLRQQTGSKNFAYLDDPEIKEKLIEFEQDAIAHTTFYLPQMHCVSCIWLLENLYKLEAGITHTSVNFLKKTVRVQFNTTQTSLRRIAALLHSIGYAPDINLGDVSGQKAPLPNRRLAYQIAVAGFAFGNVMLFSFPEYVGMSREKEVWFSQVFGALSLLIALPVLLYSARDYFVSAWEGLRQRRLNIDIPLCLALLSLFGRSVWEIVTQTGAGYLDSFTGLTFLLLIGKWFQQRVWHQLSFERDYKSYFPVAATLKQGDEERSVPVSRLVPGDIIVVRSQEIIPADGILLKGNAQVDYSFVTGEAEPVWVRSGEKIYAGGRQLGHSIQVSLTKRVDQSHLTQLWNNEAFKPQSHGQVTALADAAGRYFTWLILAFGSGALLYWWGWRGDAHTAINAFTAVMIVACPCNIALSIPFTLGNLMRLMGRERFYLKNIHTIEALAAVDAVVLDKTGTLTQVTDHSIAFQGSPLTASERSWVRSLVHHSIHPISRRIDQLLSDAPLEILTSFEEKSGLGIEGRVQGISVKVGSAAFTFDDEQPHPRGVYVTINGQVRGFFETHSQLRPGLSKVLEFFRHGLGNGRHTPVHLLSGDHNRDAALLAPFFDNSDALHFECSPQDKLNFVRQLQNTQHQVLMLGDGLNDAGALRQSNIGIVVAENTNNFTPACDAIIHAEAFDKLPAFLQLAQKGVNIVNYSYIVALTYNAIGLSFAVTGSLSPLVAAVLMPISSVSVVLFGVGMGNRAFRQAV